MYYCGCMLHIHIPQKFLKLCPYRTNKYQKFWTIIYFQFINQLHYLYLHISPISTSLTILMNFILV